MRKPSADALELLRAGAKDGSIWHFYELGDQMVADGREFFNHDSSVRQQQRWLDALNELVERNLVYKYSDEEYRLTSAGFKLADLY